MTTNSGPPAVLSYAGAAPRPAAPLWWRLSLTLACVYLPYAWLVTDDWPWGDYRWTWVKMWPVLPGLVAGIALIPRTSNATELAAMAVTTAATLAFFLYLAARSRRWVPIPTLLALALSLFNSWIAYAIYRA
jgi:hypothetical protein